MEWTEYGVAGVFSLACLACVVSVAVGLPGTWVMLALAVALEVLDSHLLGMPELVTFGWPTLGIAAAIAIAAEILEALAGAAGTRLGGGTRRGMIGAIIGGIVGAIALTPLLPIPVVGTLVGAFLGTFAGAFYAEYTVPEVREASVPARAALGAAVGRLAGTFGKFILASVIWVVLSWAAFT
jgi:uncharacterized protein YqgC (DUF456 family)